MTGGGEGSGGGCSGAGADAGSGLGAGARAGEGATAEESWRGDHPRVGRRVARLFEQRLFRGTIAGHLPNGGALDGELFRVLYDDDDDEDWDVQEAEAGEATASSYSPCSYCDLTQDDRDNPLLLCATPSCGGTTHLACCPDTAEDAAAGDTDWQCSRCLAPLRSAVTGRVSNHQRAANQVREARRHGTPLALGYRALQQRCGHANCLPLRSSAEHLRNAAAVEGRTVDYAIRTTGDGPYLNVTDLARAVTAGWLSFGAALPAPAPQGGQRVARFRARRRGGGGDGVLGRGGS